MVDKRIENEITHGKYLADHGAGEIWNWETPAGKIRWVRRVKMLTENITKNDKILEIGCGTGYFTKEIAKTGAQITAIDISPDLIEIAKKETYSFLNINYKIENAYSMSFDDNSFDKVIGSSVLHHLEVDKALSEIYRVLKINGSIKFTEPNMLNPQIALQKNIAYIKKRLGDSPDETAFFKFQMKRKLIKAGFKNNIIKYFDFVHPSVPPVMIKTIDNIGRILEKLPVIQKISGSLFIMAQK